MNIQNLKKSKKGFTLVEIIVVLVIIAILAAIAIPAMTGWIDKANEQTAVAEARTMLLASQAVVSEYYGIEGVADGDIDDLDVTEIAELADVTLSTEGITVVNFTNSQVTDITYQTTEYTAVYDGNWNFTFD